MSEGLPAVGVVVALNGVIYIESGNV